MTKRIFYEKIGRRYRPCYEWDQGLMDAMPRGTHLVMCYPGGQSTRYNVDPNLAALIAAGRMAEDAMCNAVRKASEMRPTHTPITKEQRQAWLALIEAFGDDLATLVNQEVGRHGRRLECLPTVALRVHRVEHVDLLLLHIGGDLGVGFLEHGQRDQPVVLV